MTRVLLLVTIVLAGTLASVRPARADAVVTLCNQDRQPGPGVNLASALAIGGTITFRCPPATTIAMTARTDVPGAAVIDGGKTITLTFGTIATNVPGLNLTGPSLSLRGLHLRGPGVGAGPNEDLIATNGGSITLKSCEIDDAMAVFVQHGSLALDDDAFERSNVGVVADAKTVTMSNVAAADNPTADFVQVTANTVRLHRLRLRRSGTVAVVSPQTVLSGSTFSESGRTAGTAVPAAGALSLGCSTSPCQAAVSGSTFIGNRATSGAGIGAYNVALTISNTTFEDNVATANGGALRVLGSGSSLTLMRSVFERNSAGTGGAIDLQRNNGNDPTTTMTANAVTFADNTATGGGGGAIASDTPFSVNRGLFVRNHSSASGAALALNTTLPSRFVNVVVAGNVATSGAGGIDATTIALINATIASNTGGGMKLGGVIPSATLSNTVISANGSGNCLGGRLDFYDHGENLQFPDQSCGATVKIGNPQLNEYFEPASGGPAAAAGSAVVCRAAPVDGFDVYGSTRSFATCSIGAVEQKSSQRISNLDRRFAGLMLPLIVAGFAAVYFVVAAILATMRHGADAVNLRIRERRALTYGCISLLVSVCAAAVWFELRGLPSAFDLNWLIIPCALLYGIGVADILRLDDARRAAKSA